jgi:bifunctional DNA-binding transcriptional regulator/antitoxin component of YhaV-PrlF toxin-antitoxin module
MHAEPAPAKRSPDPPSRRSQQIVAALVLPDRHAASRWQAGPLPVPDLQQLPRDGSMLYGIGRVDSSGRVSCQEIVDALGWQPGDGVEVIIAPQAIVMRASAGGLVSVPQRPRVVIPVTARRRRGISPGDHVLLAAAPENGVVIVHTLAELDEMLAGYHSSPSLAS